MSDLILTTPVELTDSELDLVGGAALLNVAVIDVGNRNTVLSNHAVQVAVPVAAAAAIAALGSGAAAFTGQPGRINF